MKVKLEAAINQLNKLGLNLIAIEKVGNLSSEFQDSLRKNQIGFDLQDSIILLAHGGEELWRQLPHPIHEDDDPIDNFSLRAMREFADSVIDGECKILFPLTDYLLPLQKLSRELNLSRPSPLGLDISQNFGVWFAFRGMLITKRDIPSLVPRPFESPCLTCKSQECANACPVGAVKLNSSFEIKTCADYRFSDGSACADKCLARLACPYQSEHRYEILQTQYHMGRSRHLRSLASYVKLKS